MGKNCEHKNDKYKCRICNPTAFCKEHDRYKYSCSDCNSKYKKVNRNRTKCEHNKRKDSCSICSGCEHGKLVCILCNPKSFCEHKVLISTCKKCKGGAICEHNKIRSKCCECSKHNFCEHNKLTQLCIHCNTSSISFCEHKKLKWNCIECQGRQICIHKKLKRFCKDCGGSQICIHNKQKTFCLKCGGGAICEHKIRRYDCKICNPEKWLINILRASIRRVLTNNKCTNKELYLGCSYSQFQEYFISKMSDDMTIDNIHIDHIKPVSKFNLNDLEEIKACCHWSNLQPLLGKDNLQKSNKWTNENEIYWKKYITKYNSS